MHAFILSSGSKNQRLEDIQKRLNELSISQFDAIWLRRSEDEEHIGIARVRTLAKQLILSPSNSPMTAGIIVDAQLLTIDAQNALLKLLEEPPPHATLFLEVENEQLLLPTIVSRCQVIKLQSIGYEPTSAEILQQLQTLLADSIANKLSTIDQIAPDRESAKEWVREAITAARHQLRTNFTHTHLIRKLIACQKEIERNVNPKLALDSIFLCD